MRPEITLHVVKMPGSAGDFRSQAAVLKAVSPGGELAGATVTLVYCAFRAHAQQVGSR
jgi:hypothetical protein